MRWSLWLFLVSAGCTCPSGVMVEFVSEGAGVTLSVCTEVLDTEEARRSGLRGRAALASDEGVLLDFPFTSEICIVNDGVRFGIDAVYVGPDDRVVAVERGIPAGDAAPRCHPGVQRVLEVNADAAAAVGIGDRYRQL